MAEKEFAVDFTYRIQEWGTVNLKAESREQAEDFGYDYVMDTFEEVSDIVIEGVREIKTDGVQ